MGGKAATRPSLAAAMALWRNLAMVSAGMSIAWPSSSAATAVGASPMTLPAPLRQAFARVAIAVVLPLPAGAKAT